MLGALIKRPIGVLMTTLAIIIVSIVFVRDISISLLPDIPIPHITVQINAADLDARTLENTITRTVRNQMLQVNDLKDIESRTRNGSAIIDLTLDYGVNTQLSYIEVNEKMDQIMSLLPRDIQRPRVIQSNVSDIPVLYVNMRSRDRQLTDHIELSLLAQNVIKRRLEQLAEIAFVDLHGYSSPELLIQPNAALLRSLNISEQQLTRVLQEANIELGNVLIRDGQYEYNVRLNNRLTRAEDVRQIKVSAQGQLYNLDQLAKISMREQERRGSFLLDDQQAISMAVRKKSSANNFALRAKLDELFVSFDEDYPNVEFSISNDQSTILQSSFDSLSTSLYYGLGFASIVLFFFFKDWRLPLLIFLVIPISLLVSLFVFYLLGLSLNIISLTGLILGIGLMIDNSIIITENIKQLEKDRPIDIACQQGADQVIRPLISSALTTCSVFLPLILLSGLAGALFYDQALSITVALSASLVVSYFILPVLAHLILRSQQADSPPTSTHNESLHHRLIDGVLRWRYFILIGFIGVLVFGYYIFLSVPKSAFPPITRTAYQVSIDWNESIGLSESEQRVSSLHRQMSDHLIHSTSYLGEWQYLLPEEDQNINELEMILYYDQPLDENELAALHNTITQTYPNSIIQVKPLQNIFDRIFDQSEIDLYAYVQPNNQVSLPDPEQMQNLIDQLNEGQPLYLLPPLDRYIELEVNHQALQLYQLDYQLLVDQLKSTFRANVVTQLKSNNEFIPIQLISDTEQDLSEKLNTHQVINNNGLSFPLGQFVRSIPKEYYKSIESGRTGERISLPIVRYSESAVSHIQDVIKSTGLYSVTFDGPYFENQKILKELGVIGLLVLALLFLILAAQFESFIQPLIVALTLPIGSVGALTLLHFTGESLNIMSVVGLIILSGIDVNDAILKVDIFNRNRDNGIPLREAILRGSEQRLRPIVMTSLTTILAMIPILYATGLGAELQRPLAIALIGGLVVGTLASIVLVPVFYYIFTVQRE